MSMVLYGLMLNEHFVTNLLKCQWFVERRFYEVSLNDLNMMFNRSLLFWFYYIFSQLFIRHYFNQIKQLNLRCTFSNGKFTYPSTHVLAT